MLFKRFVIAIFGLLCISDYANATMDFDVFVPGRATATAPLGATDWYPVVQGGVTKKFAGSSVVTLTDTQTLTNKTINCGSNTCTVPLANVTGLGTNVATALGVNVGSAGAFLKNNGDAMSGTYTGTPTFSGNLTFSGVPIYSGLSAGTQTKCLGLDASNNLVYNAAACGSGGGGTPVVFVGNTAGAANTYTIASPTPSGFTLTDQFIVCGSISATNTGGSTLAVNGTTATAIKKQTPAGLAALTGGELIASNTQYCFQYNATGTAYVLTTQLGSGVTKDASAHTVTASEWAYGQVFDFTTSQTLTLPVATSLATNGGIFVKTEGNISVTLAPNSADGINGGTINTSVTIPGNYLTFITTTATSGTTAFQVPLGLVAGSNITLTQAGSGTTTIASSGGGGSSTIVAPQGRLTLVTGVPVMTSDQTAKSQVYYDCYVGNQVPFFNGTADGLDTIPSCEVSTIMQTTGTGVTNSGGVFDIWWEGNTNHKPCIATNGSGGGWAADTGGGNNARGTGYSQLDLTTRPYITNKNSLTHCYNGTTDYGAIAANKATYLGTLYTTAAGQTGMQFTPAGALGGANACMCLFNGYNRVRMQSRSIDSTSGWAGAGGSTWGALDAAATGAGLNNRITFVDGLAVSTISGAITGFDKTPTSQTGYMAVDLDSSSAGPIVFGGSISPASAVEPFISSIFEFTPVIGVHFIQGIEWSTANTVTFGDNGITAITLIRDQ